MIFLVEELHSLRFAAKVSAVCDEAESLPDDMRKYGLPGNKGGPGAMDVHEARGGQLWVTWNYLTGDSGTARKSRVGVLNITGSGADTDFRVALA